MMDLLKDILNDKSLKRQQKSYSTEQTFSDLFKRKHGKKQGRINSSFKKLSDRVNGTSDHPASILSTSKESDAWGSVHLEPSVLHKLDVLAKDYKIPNDLLANEIIKRCIK